MSFTAKDVQVLREKTGCGMMDCKKALTESGGDMEKAVELLREKGLSAAAKKSGRIAAEGIVLTVIDESKNVGAIIEVNSETDFVAKNNDFVQFVNLCAQTVIEKNPASVEELLAAKATGSENTIEELLREKILVIGENLKIRRFKRVEGVMEGYIHAGGRIGSLVEFEADAAVAAKPEFKEFAKNVAMQIAAIAPAYLNKEAVPADIIEKEKEIALGQIKNDEKLSSKPEAVIAKMVDGKVNKYFKDNCLLEQAYVKDGSLSVAQYTEQTAKALGGSIKVTAFTRFETGEGIEKKEDDFADEVAKMVK